MPSRRAFLGGMSACAATLASPDAINERVGAHVPDQPRVADQVTLAPWQQGTLELHHIATGRGNSTFLIAPDGTTILIDAGAIYDPLLYTIAPKPDGSRRPGEWIARYIQRRMPLGLPPAIDYAMLTHFHGDHIGQSVANLPLSQYGDFQLTGITDIAEEIEIGLLIDRDFPHYSYPSPLSDPTVANYRRFVNSRLRRGKAVAALQVGTSEQVTLKHRRYDYPQFEVANIARNGVVAEANGKAISEQFPPVGSLHEDQLPNENMCSLAWRITFGSFRYYTGGDLTNDTDFGRAPWRDIETVVAKAVGPVTVAVANHHGYVNGMGPAAVAVLAPQASIVFAWDSAHPTISPLFNMLSEDLYRGDRLVYATAVKPENAIATRDIANLASRDGHVVVRVSEHGDRFEVFVLDNGDERDAIKAHQGPFNSTRTG